MSVLRSSLVVASLATLCLLAGSARAADDDTPPPVKSPPAPPAAHAGDKDKDKDKDSTTDHQKVVGHFGASYFGQFNVGYGVGPGAGSAGTQIVGVRYWTSDTIALDLGLGLATSGGSTKTGSTTNDKPSVFGVSLKAGVPIALLAAKHYTFFIEPQLIFGYASQSIRPPGGDETKNTGMHLALGATAGAELQFGFIGIPHLALDAAIGLGLDYQSSSSKTGAAAETTDSSTAFGTAAFASPWNIFTTNVAARYYF